jgi:hypothetical protein
MRIENLRVESSPNRVKVATTVIWEDCDRPTREIYFETDAAFAQDLSCNPHAFLVGCIVPALHHGEARIAIDETICPELRNGLLTTMGWLCQWASSPYKPLRIEAKPGNPPPSPPRSEHAGSFLSGGVDSLATLRRNRLDFPPEHRRSIRDCLLVHGFDIGGKEASGSEVEVFDRALAALSAIIEDANVTLIPVSTNIRHLDDSDHFWIFEFHGAALASVAHAFSNRLTWVSIASTYDIPNLSRWGSHPLLDPNYGSAELQIRHDNLWMSRLEKVRLVADWDVALRNLRVCTYNPPGMPNCGRCEKCLRTMLELLAVGKLAHASTFSQKDVTEEMLQEVCITNAYENSCYRELIGALRAQGRQDLATCIEVKTAQFDKFHYWEEERDWKGAVKRFDRRFLGSSLFNSYRTMRRFFVDGKFEGAAP